ncbi:hypothetical protein CRI77_13700 [Mycolicibacterium duvalii]|uniref:Uncharacterized protein n=1 Tax=Mycolicibacterium duvalii TaxID=39688 RepID=A0A7I7JVJ3_9MYCO|nr:PD40 domain-containing protein [Mycolicibacterium duvalii]MCV7366989.1 PD40 domain-containing protein [Mycolicibacterium duvalii]PEG40296.1 hypothetical protein CRI77_13700 [Mycolicibacterium duvalii]BBX15887.1 hypothetical protein MDUV_07470 [Mycolicibacterium duvalii]
MHNTFGWITALLAVCTVAACTSTPSPSPDATTTSAPGVANNLPVLFYTKAGALYASDPAGAPGRKLTDGPADTEPAPSPDLTRVAYIRKPDASSYGGELWVVNLSAEHGSAGDPRRLIEPAALPSLFGDSEFGDGPGRILQPRWSPTGKQIAFLQAGEGGGFLFVADVDSGRILSPEPRVFAAEYSWAPDGRHIAWTGGRSDVSPIDVNVLDVTDTTTTAVVTGTHASSVTYGEDGQRILFANGDASGALFAEIPFLVRDGGVYSVATPEGSPAGPPTMPGLLVTGQAAFGDVAALQSGAIAYTETSADGASKTLKVLDTPSAPPRTVLADVAADAPGPVWGPDDSLAYLDTQRRLIVTNVDRRAARQVDTGVDAFAWPPPNPQGPR